jgi:D-alanyl-D-alanine carboxypeptidase (penicillin-binding protein 5/6)
MNEKLDEMGLSGTSHMTNCVGLYDDDHYSTPYDIAMILKAAADDPFCREVLSTKKYTTSASKQHKEGLLISNWFLRRIEDQDTPGEVLCAKTGYVAQSGSCAASLAMDGAGKEYICVTAGSTSSWRCIYDHVDIYNAFLE